MKIILIVKAIQALEWVAKKAGLHMEVTIHGVLESSLPWRPVMGSFESKEDKTVHYRVWHPSKTITLFE